jgi:hypothetical protein
MGINIPVNVNIENSYRATIDFFLFNSLNTFTVERWARRGLARFLTLFYAFTPRDIPKYGRRVENVNGLISFYNDNTDITENFDGTFVVGGGARAMTVFQKLNRIEQGCMDVLRCLGQISNVHKRSMLEYAVWYRENYQNPSTYGEFITLVTCHCIVSNDFMALNFHRTVVEFH